MSFSWIQNYKKYKNQQQLIEELYMPAILDSYTRVNKISGIEQLVENRIRDEFHIDFEEKNIAILPLIRNKTLLLTNENRIPQLAKRTDLSFFISGFGSFVIECKKMNSAETTYITNGVERFISGFYASKDEYGGMVAFIVGTSCEKVCNTTKQKISEHSSYVKKHVKLLSLRCSSHTTSFQSKHTRKSTTDIHMYHLFLAF